MHAYIIEQMSGKSTYDSLKKSWVACPPSGQRPLAISEMVHALPTGALVWLIVGGIIYTLGAVIYMTKKFDFFPGKFGFHEIWHIFVILGALAHDISIAVLYCPGCVMAVMAD